MSQVVVKATVRTAEEVAAHRKLAEGFGKAVSSTNGKFRVRYSPKVTYEHAGRLHVVSMKDLVSFGDELNSRKLGEFRTDEDSVVFHLNAAGRQIFDDLGQASRTMGAPGIGERRRAALASLGLAGGRELKIAPSPTLGTETAQQLLIPVLEAVTGEIIALPRIVAMVAERVAGDRKAATMPFGKSRRSLVEHVEHCLDYLASKNYVDTRSGSNGKVFSPNLKGAAVLVSGPGNGWPAFKEIETAAPVVSEICRTTSIDMDRFLNKIVTSTTGELKAFLENVSKIVSDPARSSEHEGAEDIRRIVLTEYKRRQQQRSMNPDKLDEGAFAWPETAASRGRIRLQFDELGDGMLSYFGYRVGNNGVSRSARRNILDRVFSQELPYAFPDEYMGKWGEPESPERLQKMANSLAAFTRNAKRKNGDVDAAVSDWESDLDYLYDTYYADFFEFSWPEMSDEPEYTVQMR